MGLIPLTSIPARSSAHGESSNVDHIGCDSLEAEPREAEQERVHQQQPTGANEVEASEPRSHEFKCIWARQAAESQRKLSFVILIVVVLILMVRRPRVWAARGFRLLQVLQHSMII